MEQSKLSFKKWLTLNERERSLIYRSWDKYQGEGEDILKQAYKLFKKEFGKHTDVVNTSHGLYHGGDWIIGITLRVGHTLKVPQEYLGFRVVRLFDGLTNQLKRKLNTMYKDDIARFVEGEKIAFAKCFNFTNAPYAREWLVDFVRKQLPR